MLDFNLKSINLSEMVFHWYFHFSDTITYPLGGKPTHKINENVLSQLTKRFLRSRI